MGAKSSREAPLANEQEYAAALKESVRLVIEQGPRCPREFDLDALQMNHRREMITKEMQDDLKPLKGVATDIVVNEFFQTDDTLYRFLTRVYTSFETALAMYRKERDLTERQLLFLYKGGNILRIISKEFLIELPASASRKISEFYAPFFKRSDADFSIYLDPRVTGYDTIYKEVTLLAYLVQDVIRDWFDTHMTRYFNFFRYNEEFQSHILDPYVAAFNQAVATSGANGDELDPFVNIRIGEAVVKEAKRFSYEPGNDMTIRFVDEDEDWTKAEREVALAVIKPVPQGSTMVITHNSALEFPGGSNDVRVKFNLTRTKFVFSLLRQSGKQLNISGELIDVSVPHKFDHNIGHFFDHLDSSITTYSLVYKPVCDLRFKSYSLAYLISDLEYILFTVINFPWADNKYEKRLNRLFYLYFVDIFVSLENAQSKLQMLRDLKHYIIIPLAKTTSDNLDVKKLRSGIKGFTKKYRQHRALHVNSLLSHLWSLFEKVEAEPEQADQMGEMGRALLKNVDFMITTIENVRQYCSTDGNVKMADLYDSHVDNLT